MNKQTELILEYIMEDIYYFKEFLDERLPYLFGKNSAERIQDKVTDYIHDKKHSSLMIQLCDILLDDVDWDLIVERIENYSE